MSFTNRPTVAIVHLDRLRHNAKLVLSKLGAGQEGMAIIKANAYGHGSVMVARTLEASGFKRFGVATLEEGLELRKQGIRSEIHILDGLIGNLSEYQSARLYPVIHTFEELKLVAAYAADENRDVLIDLKFDTGMGRLGFAAAQVDELMTILRKAVFLRVQCVLTHLARADEPENETTIRQYTLFRKLRDILRERGLKEARYSIVNSAALLDGRTEDFDWVRPGLCLYGAYPHVRLREAAELKPVLELKTAILAIKSVVPHTPIGYGGTFVTEKEAQIAILPIGYADGYPRLLSNMGFVLVRGKRAPIVGRISMDLTAVDVTGIPDVAVHDPVTLIGTDGVETIHVEDVAKWAQTISYEILCCLTARVPRLYQGL
jgi:alanine racemase